MKKGLTNEQAEFLCELTLRYGDALTKYAYRFYSYQPNMLHTAQDAVQDTFEKAVLDVDKLMNHPNQIGWLKVSLRNTLLNIQREQHWKKEDLRYSVSDSPEIRKQVVMEAFDRLERYPRLKEVVEGANDVLSEEEVQTFYDHFLEGLTTEETALLESVTSDTVRGRISRIRKKLRKYFGFTCCLLFILFYKGM